METREYSTGEKIFGAVFVLWFIASIVALMMTAKTSPWLALVVFGQYFLVFGVIALVSGLKNGNFKPVFLLFLFVGLLTIVGGSIMQFGNEALQEQFKGYIPYLGISIFLVTGILSILTAIVRNKMEQKCTQYVQATCIKLRKKLSQTSSSSEVGTRTRQLYCPVFGFSYGGKRYVVSSDTFTTNCDAQPGENYELYIDPNKPNRFRESGETARLNGMEIGMGIIFIVVSMFAYAVLIFMG